MKLMQRYRERPEEEASCKAQPEEEIQKGEKQPPSSQRLLLQQMDLHWARGHNHS